jgi:ATP/ADP translocase
MSRGDYILLGCVGVLSLCIIAGPLLMHFSKDYEDPTIEEVSCLYESFTMISHTKNSIDISVSTYVNRNFSVLYNYLPFDTFIDVEAAAGVFRYIETLINNKTEIHCRRDKVYDVVYTVTLYDHVNESMSTAGFILSIVGIIALVAFCLFGYVLYRANWHRSRIYDSIN